MTRRPGYARCIVCGTDHRNRYLETAQPPLPAGMRCTDHAACRDRVRRIVAAHVGLAEVCQ